MYTLTRNKRHTALTYVLMLHIVMTCVCCGTYVFFDIEIDGQVSRRIVAKLYDDTLPYIAEHMHRLCSGAYGYDYDNGALVQVELDNYIVLRNLIWGDCSDDMRNNAQLAIRSEATQHTTKHDRKYLLALNDYTKSRDRFRDAHLFITLKPFSDIQHHSVVFGEVVRGFSTIRQLNANAETHDLRFEHALLISSGIASDPGADSDDTDHSKDKQEV